MNKEARRLRSLYQYDILDSKAEKAFDDLTKLAARFCETSVAQINFLDQERQWSKSSVGWGETEMPREIGFCSNTIRSDNRLLIVEDTLKDKRFKDNPLVKKDPPIRFYAAITIKSEDDYPIGALCVYDSEPKTLTDEQVETIRILGKEVETHLKLRINQDQLKNRLLEENKFIRKTLNSLPINFFMYNEKGELIRWNTNLEKTTGYSENELTQMKAVEFFDSKDQDLVLSKTEEVFKGGQASLEADIINKSGERTPFIFSASSFEMDDEPYLIGTGQDISELKKTQKKLSLSLREKEVLLAEIHHRVKNNLAVISGVIQLQALESENPESEKSLTNTMMRVRSMAQVHEVMYKRDSLTHVAFEEVIKSLVENIKNTHGRSDNYSFNSDIEQIELNVNQAIPCGLIINELLTNAWKHAYPNGQEGNITLEMHKNGETITIRIADEGIGLPQNIEPEKGQTLGFTFVNQLCTQLNADMEVNQKHGTEYIIHFHKRDIKGSSSSLNLQR